MKLSQISKWTPVVIFINLRSCFVTNQTPLGQKGNLCDVLLCSSFLDSHARHECPWFCGFNALHLASISWVLF